jgi:hypothetical protein
MYGEGNGPGDVCARPVEATSVANPNNGTVVENLIGRLTFFGPISY